MATDLTSATGFSPGVMPVRAFVPPRFSAAKTSPANGSPVVEISLSDLDALLYPETDEVQMVETDFHRSWRNRLFDLLCWRYREQRVYVASDLFVYYRQWRSRASVAPDVFVVLDCDPRPRNSFKIWEEKRTPNFVIEVASEGAYDDDQVIKPGRYQTAGVREYFLYDPSGQFFDPPLQGYRLHEGDREYEAIPQDSHGAFASEELGLLLWLDGDELIVADRQTGQPLLTRHEEADRQTASASLRAAQAEQHAAQAKHEAEAAAQRAEQESRLRAAAEEESRRLRQEIERLRGQ